MTIGILGFLHESNTFLDTPTIWDDFATTSMTAGQTLLDRWTGVAHELGGMIEGCHQNALEIEPGFATFAVPSGTITAEAFERIADALLNAITAPIDGLLVALHGATVSEAYPDADGEILRRLRTKYGPDFPIVVTLDLHANVSQSMVDHATAITAYRSNPHLDQRERGIEAANLLYQILKDNKKPVMALEAPPWAIPIAAQNTAGMPAKALYDDLNEVLQWPGILSASVCLGFYYADVAEMGTTFLAVADNDPDLARKAASYLAERAWNRRADFLPQLPSPQQAVAHAIQSTKKPVVLMDVGDNVGGGSSASSRTLYEECVKQGAAKVVVVLYDRQSVDRCIAAGVRGEVAEGRVTTIFDGIFTETQVRHGGWSHFDQGISAVVETPQGNTILYTSRRMAPMSLEQLLRAGIHPERQNILIVKGVIAPQAAYAPIAGEIILVDTPGPTANDPRSFTYRNRRRPLYPIELDA
ncbi:microcystinase C [Bryobacterales bacterium F-183]|nr:microcystinase C [Bryobacterales bacterium F-183]